MKSLFAIFTLVIVVACAPQRDRFIEQNSHLNAIYSDIEKEHTIVADSSISNLDMLNATLRKVERGGNEINDSAFIATITTKVCSIVAIYPYVNGTIYDRVPHSRGGLGLATLQKLLFMPKGKGRICNDYTIDPTNRNTYTPFAWSYDTATNRLTTTEFLDCRSWGARLLYFDNDTAILKGFIHHYPYNCDWGYIVLDFTQCDRNAIEKQFQKNIFKR